MTDNDFKAWMKSEISEIKTDIAAIRKTSTENAETLKRYLWFWRAARYVGGALIAIVVANWDSFIKLLIRH